MSILKKSIVKKIKKQGIASALKFLVLSLILLLVVAPPLAFAADPVPSGATNTTVNSASNGVPVVDIAAPNTSGMSHNAFTSFNVDAHGLVLNNGDLDQASRTSQLAGQIDANPNLAAGNQASIILNEVTGNGRTALNGFTEVLGGKADVIIANPFGITSSGGGFINTDRISLVTGAPDLTGGNLNGFNVPGGDILITGTGLDASDQQILNLVSRKIAIEGDIKGQTVNLVAGTNHWNHDTGAASAIASDGSAAPAWAIDSSALGGMYAGRINLKATEAGVGVRMKGNAAATTDDFIITSSGKIEISSLIAVERDLGVTTTTSGDDAIKVADAILAAKQNISLTASNGGATLMGGSIKADGTLEYHLGTLTDTAVASSDNPDANKRFGGTVALNGTGAWVLDGTNYGATSALTLNAQSLAVGATAVTTFNSEGTMDLAATGSNLVALSKTYLNSAGNMTLKSNTGDIGIAKGAQAQTTAGNLLLAAKNLSNSGNLWAQTGGIELSMTESIGNLGNMSANGLFKIQNPAGSLYNYGALLSGSLEMQSRDLVVLSGGSMESTGDMNLSISNNLTVGGAADTSSRILAATDGTGTGTIMVQGAITNYGTLQSKHDLSVYGGSIENISTGAIVAANDLTAGATSTDFVNQGALYAGNDLVASASGTFLNNSTLAAPLGTINSGRDMSFTANTFINSSYIDAGRNLTISAPIFKNQVKGGDTRAWKDFVQFDKQMTGSTGWTYCGWFDQHRSDYYLERFRAYQYFLGGSPEFVPHIYGGGTGTVHIKDFNSGENTGSAISGDTITITGNAGATFINTDLSLYSAEAHQTYEHYMKDWGTSLGPPYEVNQIQHMSVPVVVSTVVVEQHPSTIRANTLNATGFSLVNSGSPNAPSSPNPGTSSPGQTLILPTNPNGMFVASKTSSDDFLVKSNSWYSDDFLGSEYLAEKYDLKPDKVLKRLGDAGYETYLVGQQLASQIGSKFLWGYANQKDQMKGLMDNAMGQAGKLGLVYGQPLSRTAQLRLKKDMIWMVETEVNGQMVLAPVVYLAPSTKQMFASGNGANIAAQNINMNLDAVTNTGGTIAGAKTLNMTTRGDIANISGTMVGGQVSLTSTEGSIINQTQATTTGDGSFSRTQIGRQANIVATGDLNLNAAKDIVNAGANIAAKGDASLSAGNDVILDTIQDTSTSQSHSGITKTATNTTRQIGSTLSSGGNLTVNAQNDVTLAGSTVTAGKDADLSAGNNLNVLARHDSQHTVSNTEKEGFGVAGGLWGKESKSRDQMKTTAGVSTIKSHGNTNLSAEKRVLLEGAKLDAGKDINIAASDVSILEARDTETVKTHSQTTSVLSTSAGEGDSSASASGSASGAATGDSASASAGASATASASASHDAGGLDFKKTITQTTSDEKTRAVGSKLKASGSINISAVKEATLRGADVSAGQDINLSGENVNILAAQDTHVTSTTTSTSRVGLYAKTNNSADAQAGAAATADAGKTGASAAAGGKASANAASKTTVDFVRKLGTTNDTLDITHTGTSLASGGTLNINAKKNLLVQGSDVSGEQGVNLEARDMAFTAAQDVHITSSSTTQSSTGLYVDGDANANAAGNAAAKAGLKLGAGASAAAAGSASAKASLAIGVQNKTAETSTTQGFTRARVSSIRSGSGSITRTAENSITDVGTAIEAGNDFIQTAKTFDSKAAENTSFSTSSSSDSLLKAGVYAKAEAGASATAGANAEVGRKGALAESSANAKVSANVGAGVKMDYNKNTSESSSSASQAVVSIIKAGGRIKTTTSGATTMEGTRISSKEGVEIKAASLDYKAAKNTTASASSTGSSKVAASIGVTRGTGKGIEGGLSGGTASSDRSENTSQAVVGSIESGGNITIQTDGNTRLEGTRLGAAGDTSIAAGGEIVMDAARDTASAKETSSDLSGGVSFGESAGSQSTASVAVEAAIGGSKAQASSSTARAGSIATGGKLTLSSGKSISLEGTDMNASGDAVLSAKEGVHFNAAKSSSQSESKSGQLGGGIGKTQTSDAKGSTDTRTLSGNASATYSRSKETVAKAGSLSSGGNLVINSGSDVTLEGTDLGAGNKVTVNAEGGVNFKAAKSSSESTTMGASVSGSSSKTTKTPKTPLSPPAPPVKTTNPGTGGTQGSDGSAKSDKDLSDWQKKHGNVMEELKAKQNPAASAPQAAGAQTAPGPAAPPVKGNTSPVTKKVSAVKVSGTLHKEARTTQKAVTIQAGAGGIEINARQ